MSQNLKLKVSGLFTNFNQLSGVPEGALSKAVNVVIDKGIAESRRGFDRLANPTVDVDDRTDRLSQYQNHLISHRINDNKLSYYNAGWTDYAGTYIHPDTDYAKIRFVESNGNLYFTESTGIKMLDAYNGVVYNAGMPKGLDGSAVVTGASGFMTNDTQVAYRVVWGSRDANNNLYLGSPSQRIIATNSSGGTRDASITFTIPAGMTTSEFYQVYRSKESATALDEPNDELQLCYESNPTSGEITAKSITFTDSAPVSLLGASLYTNSNQEGIQEENDEPPFAQDICEFKGFMFYANIKRKHYINVKLLSVGGTSGLALDDTITINSIVYTAKASEAIASAQFKISTGGSASQNIDDTARSLVRVINQHTSNVAIDAYYTTGYNDLPGQIMLRKRSIDDISFSVAISKATSWDIGTSTSNNERIQNGLSYSKIQQPEHVPTSHVENVGSKSFPIRRILALRDSLFILKDDGVWRLTGVNGSWSISALDTSTKILAPDSAVVVNNQIMCLADQGIVSISDNGVSILSEPIKDQIVELVGSNLDNVKKLSYGIAYETDRKYILYTISETSDDHCTQAFVLNTFTNAWTKWNKPSVHGIVNKTDDRLYLAKFDERYILQERKTFSFRDYVDEQIDGYSVISYVTNQVVLNTVAGLTIGDLVYSSATVFSPITAIDVSTSTVTVNDSKTWPVGAVSVYLGIDSQIEWASLHADNPGIEKYFQEVTLMFKEERFNFASVDFYTDVSGGYSETPVTGNYGGGSWGLFAWGLVPWGGISRPKPIRVTVPRDKNRGTLLSVRFKHRVGYGVWGVQGLSLQFDFTSERVEQ